MKRLRKWFILMSKKLINYFPIVCNFLCSYSRFKWDAFTDEERPENQRELAIKRMKLFIQCLLVVVVIIIISKYYKSLMK